MKRKSHIIQAGDYVLNLDAETAVMGIINMTPDSFSADGCWINPQKAFLKAEKLAQKMIRDGAKILDVGGESSKPGSLKISVDEERRRVIPLVKILAKKYHVPISVDTYKFQIAKEALDAGASMINTIQGVSPDKRLLKAVCDDKAAIILMHMRKTPRTMQKNITYRDVVEEIIPRLARKRV